MREGWRFTRKLCVLACVAGSILLTSAHAQEARDERPNILVVMTDDQGLGQMPCYLDLLPSASAPAAEPTPRYACDMDRAVACARVAMPNLETLARQGVTFTQAYAAAPMCGPSRAALLSARYPQRCGLYGNDDAVAAGLPASELCLPALLKDAGYRTAMIGAWHVSARPDTPLNAESGAEDRNPLKQAFDVCYGVNGAGAPFCDSPSVSRNSGGVYSRGYRMDEFTDKAMQFVRETADQPFFVCLAYNAPHIPLAEYAPVRYLNRFNSGNREVDNYYATLVAVDDGLGRLVSLLRRTDRLENTLIVFLSDNGAVVDSPSPGNAPSAGFKGQFRMGGVRVPMIAVWPKGLKHAGRSDALVSAMDVLPTALAAAKVALPENLDGRNLLPFLNRETGQPPHEFLFWAGPESFHWGAPNASFWVGYFDYLKERAADKPVSSLTEAYSPAAWAVRHDRWLLRYNADVAEPLLYDLAADPSETRNLAGQQPETVRKLTGAAQAWLKPMARPVQWNAARWEQLRNLGATE